MDRMNLSLKQWRRLKKMSQTELAEKLAVLANDRVGQSHVSSYERGAMPGWNVGEAIRKLSKGIVTPESFAGK